MRVKPLLRNDILTLLKKGSKYYTKGFGLVMMKCNELKLTISVSRSFGKAHDRNKIKRRLYNIIHGKYMNIMLWFRINSSHTIHNDFDLLQNDVLRLLRVYKCS